MSEEKVWNDETRNELRERLRFSILGELRMAKRNHEEIVEHCRQVYIEDECRESERSMFVQFAVEELSRAEAQLQIEKITWPEETDSDRLDRVENALRERGILLWQASPCCDTCTGGELPNRIDLIEDRYPGFRDRIRGYSFYIDQTLPESLAEGTEVSVYLAYGWFSPDDSEIPPENYRRQALAIAREVCECLRDQKFEPDWNGSYDKKIGVSLNWQRRKLLE
jgi:hypothetical protein